MNLNPVDLRGGPAPYYCRMGLARPVVNCADFGDQNLGWQAQLRSNGKGAKEWNGGKMEGRDRPIAKEDHAISMETREYRAECRDLRTLKHMAIFVRGILTFSSSLSTVSFQISETQSIEHVQQVTKRVGEYRLLVGDLPCFHPHGVFAV